MARGPLKPKLFDFNPRWYQQEALEAFYHGYKRLLWRWSRRSGKDFTGLHLMTMEAIANPGTIYHYAFPFKTWGYEIFWTGRTNEGKSLRSYIPLQHLDQKLPFYEKRMEVRFRNGSIIRIVAFDDPDSMVGQNPTGVFFSEYALNIHAEVAWTKTYLPILRFNQGWAIFASTPRRTGQHYRRLYESAIENRDRWFVSSLTIEDLGTFNQKEIELIIAEDKADGMSESDVLEEYYVRFDVPDVSTYWGIQLLEAYDTNRITDVPHDRNLPVATAWDIGNDGTAIWFIQQDKSGSIRIIDYLEDKGYGIDYYIQQILLKPYVYSAHLGPHDVRQRSRIFTNTSIESTAREFGLSFTIIPKLGKKEQIDSARRILSKCYFDRTKCDIGLDHLRNYSGTATTPKHDEHCIAGWCKVRTLKGWVPIRDIKPNDYVYGFNGQRIVPAKITAFLPQGFSNKIVEVRLDNGKTITCTENHKFMLRDGSYKEAIHLEKDDSLMPFYESIDGKYLSINLNDGSKALEHRYVYNYLAGHIPDPEIHIDHIDQDHFNNCISNLQTLTKDQHCSKTFKDKNNEERKSVDNTDYSREIYNSSIIFKECKQCLQEYEGTYKDSYCSVECRLMWRRINHSPTERQKRQKNKKAKEKYWIEKESNHKVRSIKRLNISVEVYDITVEGIHNFVCEGVIIHNSHASDAFQILAVGEHELGYNPDIDDQQEHCDMEFDVFS